MNSIITISNLKKSFGSNKVLKGVSLEVFKGEKLVIIGRSGCGKSVLLKHIVGLLKPDEGTVICYGKDVNLLSKSELFRQRLKFGYLFQGAALFDSMTVGENISLPLIEHFNLSKAEVSKKVAEKLAMVGLPGIERLKPSELSGGMKKRVGLARAIITEPDIILYDEPTTGLDPIMSDAIDELVNHLTRALKITTIVITHDMESVKKVADRVIMLHEGLVHFEGMPSDLFKKEDSVIKNFVTRQSAGDHEIESEMQELARKI